MQPLAIAIGGSARARPAFFFDAALPPGAVLTRASSAARFTGAGVLGEVAADAPRFDHWPASGAARGLLIEPAAANLMSATRTIGATGWNVAAMSVTQGAALAPDGTMAAARLVCAASSIAQGVDQTRSLSAGSHVISMFLKADGIRYLQFLSGGFSSGAFANFDLVAGVVNAAGAAGIENAGNGWWRCWMAATLAGTTGQMIMWAVDGLAAARASAFTGNGAAALLAWGAQLETGVAPSSFIAGASAPANRAADGLTLNFGAQGVADGTRSFRATFDDESSATFAAAVAGGTMTVPLTLARRHLRAIELA